MKKAEGVKMILCIGELLADMSCERRGDGVYYKRCVGGAPFNVACAIGKCGGSAGFFGNVGEDNIGAALKEYAQSRQFDYLFVGSDKAHNTTLAFVDIDEEGERSFTFYRKNTADYYLDKDLAAAAIARADIVHLGSLMLSEKVGLAFARFVREEVRRQGKRLSFDVNFRTDIFPDKQAAVSVYREFVDGADILKLSEDELPLFADEGETEAQMRALGAENKLVVVTLGKRGSAYYYNGRFSPVPSQKVKAVDTTGAGDAFWGALLTCIDERGLEDLDGSMRFANVCGALTTTRKGSAEAVPSLEEIRRNL